MSQKQSLTSYHTALSKQLKRISDLISLNLYSIPRISKKPWNVSTVYFKSDQIKNFLDLKCIGFISIKWGKN